MNSKTLLNGVACESPLLNDRSMHFGDGLFETIAVKNGVPCLWDRHFLRLKKGCQRLNIQMPDASVLLQEALSLCEGQSQAVLKVILSAGQIHHGYRRDNKQSNTRIMSVRDWPQSPPYNNNHLGISLGLCETRLASQPLLAGIKHLNRLEQVLARTELSEEMFEGLMRDQQGNIIEGTMSNLLLQNGDDFITPAIQDSGVEGVIRALMIDTANKQTARLSVAHVSLEQVRDADRLYIMNSLLGVRTVSSFESKQYEIFEMPNWLNEVNDIAFLKAKP